MSANFDGNSAELHPKKNAEYINLKKKIKKKEK